MAFSLEKIGIAPLVVKSPAAPGDPYLVQYRLPKTTSRVWMTLIFTKDVADLAINLWSYSSDVSGAIPVQHVKRNTTTGAILDDPTTLSASKNCCLPLDVNPDADMVELRVLPSSLLGNDVLKIGLAAE